MVNNISISSSITYVGSNPLLTIISVIVAIVSVVVTIVIYMKSKRERVPQYSMVSYNIIKDFVNMFDALEIRYAGQTVKDLTVSKIIFWNAGRETIDKDHIVKTDPIMICMNGNSKILDQKIIAMNNETNNFSLIPCEDRSKVNVEFDYVDKNEGAVIQIIHTGKSNKDIEFHGRIKGAGEPKIKDLGLLSKKLDQLGTVLFIIGAAILIMSIYYFQSFVEPMRNGDMYESIFIIIVSIIITGLIRTAYYISKRCKKFPKGLEIFTDDVTKCENDRKR